MLTLKTGIGISAHFIQLHCPLVITLRLGLGSEGRFCNHFEYLDREACLPLVDNFQFQISALPALGNHLDPLGFLFFAVADSLSGFNLSQR